MSWLSALGVLFVGLKLAEIITWSWWLVLLPFYGVAALAFFILVVAIMAALTGSK